jgi:hypothetical protein
MMPSSSLQATAARLAEDPTPLTAAWALYTADAPLVRPAARRTAEEFLVMACEKQARDHPQRTRIAIKLFETTTSPQVRQYAEDALLDAMSRAM